MARFLGLVIALGLSSASLAQVSLELTTPVGPSPKVFTKGWVFGARATIDGKDASAHVKWSGSGSFDPAVGARSRPSFKAEGANTVTLTIRASGKEVSRTFKVQAVKPDGYAAVGDIAFCPADSHPDAAGTMAVEGPILTGSPNVTVRGQPAARKGDSGSHALCSGSNTFEILAGDPEVLIDGHPAARFGDPTQHCGGVGMIVRNRQAQHVVSFEGSMSPPIFKGSVRMGLVPGVPTGLIRGSQGGVSPTDSSVKFHVVWSGTLETKSGSVKGEVLITRTAGKQVMRLSGDFSGKLDTKSGVIEGVVIVRAFGGELKSALVLYRIGGR